MKPVSYKKFNLMLRDRIVLEDKYFDGIEVRNCSQFGCGKPLTLSESLAGNKCTEHLKEKRIDPMDVIKMK